MEGAIGALFFVLAIGLIGTLCYRHREALHDWLESKDKLPKDAKMDELKDNIKTAKDALKRYQRRLQLQQQIDDATDEISDIDKTEAK